MLEWGGVVGENRPRGLVRLYKSGVKDPVAYGPDTVYYSMNMVPGWPDGKAKLPGDAPLDTLWYRFCLSRDATGRIRVMLTNVSLKPDGSVTNLRRVSGNTTNPGRSLIIEWTDSGRVGGTPLTGSALELSQEGTAKWRNLRAIFRKVPP